MRGFVFVIGLVAMGMIGCSSAPRSPLAPDPQAEPPLSPLPPGPITIAPPDTVTENEELPRSIRRLVAEQRDEVCSLRTLAAELADRRGRSRAMREAEDIAEELSAIEAEIASAGTNSELLDAIVTRLHRLETKTSLMHDALRQASL